MKLQMLGVLMVLILSGAILLGGCHDEDKSYEGHNHGQPTGCEPGQHCAE
jgi:hypothetical protein